MEEKIIYIRGLLASNKLIEAIEEIGKTEFLSGSERNDLSILSSRIFDLNRKVNLGVISNEDENLERNRIRISILSFATDFLRPEVNLEKKLKKNISLELIGELFNNTDIIFRIDWSPCGSYLACPTKDMKVTIWNVKEQSLIKELKFSREVNAVKWLNNSKEVACGLDGGLSYVYNIEKELKTEVDIGQTSITCFGISNDGRFLALGGTSRRVFIWDKETEEINDDLYEHRDIIWALDWSADNKYLASGSRDKNICIWDVENKKLITKLEGHKRYVTSVKWIPNSSRFLISSSDDETIRVWDTVKGICLKTIHNHKDRVCSVSISFDGRFFASKSNDEFLKIYDYDSGEEIYAVKELSSNFVFPSIAFNPKELVLASFGKQDTSIRLWKIVEE